MVGNKRWLANGFALIPKPRHAELWEYLLPRIACFALIPKPRHAE